MPSFQSVPDPPALDWPPVSKHDANFLSFLTSVDLFNWKLALHLLVPWRMFMTIVVFVCFFYFQLMSPYRTDGGDS